MVSAAENLGIQNSQGPFSSDTLSTWLDVVVGMLPRMKRNVKTSRGYKCVIQRRIGSFERMRVHGGLAVPIPKATPPSGSYTASFDLTT